MKLDKILAKTIEHMPRILSGVAIVSLAAPISVIGLNSESKPILDSLIYGKILGEQVIFPMQGSLFGASLISLAVKDFTEGYWSRY